VSSGQDHNGISAGIAKEERKLVDTVSKWKVLIDSVKSGYSGSKHFQK